MEIVEERLFNKLIPTENKYLVDIEEYSQYLEEKKTNEDAMLSKSTEIYLPKSVDINYCKKHYVEKGEELNDNRPN